MAEFNQHQIGSPLSLFTREEIAEYQLQINKVQSELRSKSGQNVEDLEARFFTEKSFEIKDALRSRHSSLYTGHLETYTLVKDVANAYPGTDLKTILDAARGAVN